MLFSVMLKWNEKQFYHLLNQKQRTQFEFKYIFGGSIKFSFEILKPNAYIEWNDKIDSTFWILYFNKLLYNCDENNMKGILELMLLSTFCDSLFLARNHEETISSCFFQIQSMFLYNISQRQNWIVFIVAVVAVIVAVVVDNRWEYGRYWIYNSFNIQLMFDLSPLVCCELHQKLYKIICKLWQKCIYFGLITW
jgi:hypothetical protein